MRRCSYFSIHAAVYAAVTETGGLHKQTNKQQNYQNYKNKKTTEVV